MKAPLRRDSPPGEIGMLGGGTWPSPFVSVFGGLLAARLAASILGG